MSALDFLNDHTDERRRHETSVVTMLLNRFQIPRQCNLKMLDENNLRWGERFLSLDLFFEFFPMFPTRLVLEYPFDLRKVFTAGVLFKNFGGSKLVEVYDRRFWTYVEPGTENMVAPADRILLGLPPPMPLTNFGVVFHGQFELGGGLVLHNHPIDVDVPGSRLLWISEAGHQLVLEPLQVLMDSIDNAAGAEGWIPEAKPEFAVCA
jgi:hypothetical protein